MRPRTENATGKPSEAWLADEGKDGDFTSGRPIESAKTHSVSNGSQVAMLSAAGDGGTGGVKGGAGGVGWGTDGVKSGVCSG